MNTHTQGYLLEIYHLSVMPSESGPFVKYSPFSSFLQTHIHWLVIAAIFVSPTLHIYFLFMEILMLHLWPNQESERSLASGPVPGAQQAFSPSTNKPQGPGTWAGKVGWGQQ